MELPFAERVFDAVLALDVIEHVEDDVALLREARRVLRPGGIVVLTVPALPWLWSDHDVVNHHYRRYVRSTLDRSVRAGGFTPVHTSYYNSFPLPLAVARKGPIAPAAAANTTSSRCPGRSIACFGPPTFGVAPHPPRRDPLGASLVCTARRS
ncbi:MAG: methyltransferase domain-containing protein [Dehalococcoidia bacterium]